MLDCLWEKKKKRGNEDREAREEKKGKLTTITHCKSFLFVLVIVGQIESPPLPPQR